MKKPEGMEEYDGYPMPEPRTLSDEEKNDIMQRVEKLRERAKKANAQKPSE